MSDRWQKIETHDGSTASVVIATVDGAVGEARLVDEHGWWWAGNDPTDVWGQQQYPTHWMPLPDPPPAEDSRV